MHYYHEVNFLLYYNNFQKKCDKKGVQTRSIDDWAYLEVKSVFSNLENLRYFLPEYESMFYSLVRNLTEE